MCASLKRCLAVVTLTLSTFADHREIDGAVAGVVYALTGAFEELAIVHEYITEAG